VKKVPICPRCDVEAVIMKSSEPIYGRDYGPVWVCQNFPACDCRCGCHPGTQRPLGTLADAETRRLRKEAHSWFDPLWKRGRNGLGRSAAYGWLATAMNLPRELCHISMFTADQCSEAIRCIQNFRGPGGRQPTIVVVGQNYVPSDDSSPPF